VAGPAFTNPNLRPLRLFLEKLSPNMSQFDADALERAAKAARELEKSPHVKAAVELAKREQNVEARKAEAKAAEAKAEMERLHLHQIEVQGAERRKTIQFQREQNEVRGARNSAVDRLAD
jgi:ATPase family AAA domain-containing protein 3A/B